MTNLKLTLLASTPLTLQEALYSLTALLASASRDALEPAYMQSQYTSRMALAKEARRAIDRHIVALALRRHVAAAASRWWPSPQPLPLSSSQRPS